MLFRLAELLLVLLPLAGMIVAGVKAFLATQQRRVDSAGRDRVDRPDAGPWDVPAATRPPSGGRSNASSKSTVEPMRAGWSTSSTSLSCWTFR
ncbi:hypothetical protein I552_6559 [Mycobacterium xenopi 3993]|nr:hypothetical protein I552_6559 [Mycobacterium xenopi 3993]